MRSQTPSSVKPWISTKRTSSVDDQVSTRRLVYWSGASGIKGTAKP